MLLSLLIGSLLHHLNVHLRPLRQARRFIEPYLAVLDVSSIGHEYTPVKCGCRSLLNLLNDYPRWWFGLESIRWSKRVLRTTAQTSRRGRWARTDSTVLLDE